MTTPKLYTATVRGVDNVLIWEESRMPMVYRSWQVVGGHLLHPISENTISNCTEVTVVPKNAVVIEGGGSVLRDVGPITVREILESASSIVGSRTGYIGVKMNLDALVAQLTPSAEPTVIIEKWISGQDGSGGATTETEGGDCECGGKLLGERCCDNGYFGQEHDCQKSDASPPSTVTIELTEDRLGWFKSIEQFLRDKKRPGWADFIAEVIPLTPPRPEEPKVGEVFTAFYDGNSEEDCSEYMRWTDNPAIVNQYIDISEAGGFTWSDLKNPSLVNPVVLSEGQVG